MVERRRVRAFENESSEHFCECLCVWGLGVVSGEGEMGFYHFLLLRDTCKNCAVTVSHRFKFV